MIASQSFLLEYLPILIFLGIAAVIAVGAVAASYIAAPQNPDADKVSAYECGFDAFDDAHEIGHLVTNGHEVHDPHKEDQVYVTTQTKYVRLARRTNLLVTIAHVQRTMFRSLGIPSGARLSRWTPRRAAWG